MSNTITIVQGDYGVEYRLNIVKGTPSLEDSFLFTIKDVNGVEKVRKTYTNITSYIPVVLNKQDTNKLLPITYYYCVDWYRNGVFQSNVVNGEKFVVKKKV